MGREYGLNPFHIQSQNTLGDFSNHETHLMTFQGKSIDIFALWTNSTDEEGPSEGHRVAWEPEKSKELVLLLCYFNKYIGGQ